MCLSEVFRGSTVVLSLSGDEFDILGAESDCIPRRNEVLPDGVLTMPCACDTALPLLEGRDSYELAEFASDLWMLFCARRVILLDRHAGVALVEELFAAVVTQRGTRFPSFATGFDVFNLNVRVQLNITKVMKGVALN
jgi:hypothetical protein